MSGLSSRRAHTLESDFFHRDNHKCHGLETDENALCMATGIVDCKLLDELLAQGITPQTLIAFSLFPAVCVAWADGKIELSERMAILEAAESLNVSRDSSAGTLLRSWLTEQPTDGLMGAWKDFVHAVRPTMSVKSFRELQKSSMKFAVDIAESASGVLNILNVSAAEKDVIAELQKVFDHAANTAEFESSS